MTAKKKDPLTALILIVAFVIFVIAIALLLNTYVFQAQTSSSDLDVVMTLNPTIRANATTIPLATPLSDADASEFLQLQAQILACPDYSSERRAQMLQHIEWLINPSTIPSDIISAFGTNVQGGLVFGMASYTSIQWRLLERPANSCLVAIGQQLEILLMRFGREALGIYEGISQP